MKVRSLLLILLILSAVLIVILIGVRAAPRVVAHSPSTEGGPVPAASPLRLTFSRTMLPDSVAARLSTFPPSAGAAVWEGQTLIFTPAEPWPLGMTVTVRLEAGALSSLRLPMLGEHSWSFRVSLPQLLYLWPADGPADLYALETIEGEIQRLTRSPHGVLDYSLDPAGLSLYYSAVNSQGGADLYRLDRLTGASELLLPCPEDQCRQVRSSPQGDRLAFVRAPLVPEPGSAMASVEVLALDSGSGTEPRTLGELAEPTDALAWSALGLLLYHDAGESAYVAVDPASGERFEFPNQTGEPGAWAPDGRGFVAPELLALPGVETSTGEPVTPSHLMRYEIDSPSAQDLSQLLFIEDTSPAFSPDGSRLAFARKYLDAERWSLGRQLWVMDPAGGGGRGLTNDPGFNHTSFAWSPDGDRIVFLRFDLTALTRPPEIWQINADGANPLRLVIGGYAPQWTP